MSSKLTPSLRLLKRLHIIFDPYDPSVRCARELVRQVSAKKFKARNPKCDVGHTFKTGAPPKMMLTFINDTERSIDLPWRRITEVFSDWYFVESEVKMETGLTDP